MIFKSSGMGSFLGMIMAVLVMAGLFGCEDREKHHQPIKIGIVNLTPTLDNLVEGFKSGLTELGYIENETVVYIYGGASGTLKAIDPQIEHIIEEEVDLILSLTTPVSLRVKELLGDRNTPVIFAPVIDPVKAGLVKSLQEPGGNFTGVMATGAASKGLEWLLAIVPDLERVYVPFSLEDKSMAYSMADLKKAAAARNIELVIGEAVTETEVISVLKNIPEDVQAIWELPSGFWAPYLQLFVQSPIEHRIPLMASNQIWAEMGAVISLGDDTTVIGKQASRLADKILQGAPPAILPVEKSDLFLYLNAHTAEIIGLKLPVKVLKQANHVFR